MLLNGGPLEKQRQLKSQPSLKMFDNNNNNYNGHYVLELSRTSLVLNGVSK